MVYRGIMRMITAFVTICPLSIVIRQLLYYDGACERGTYRASIESEDIDLMVDRS